MKVFLEERFMKKVLLTVILMSAFNVTFASDSSVEDHGLKECTESVQSSRGRDEIKEAQQQIVEDATSTSTDK